MIVPCAQDRPAGTAGAVTQFQWSSGLAMVALCGLTVTFYYGLWWPDQVLIKRDAFWFHLPTKQYLIERLSADELPQWFPYEGLGRPFIGTAAAGVFHPFTALYFLFSVPDAYRLSTLTACLLGALGAFALGRTLRLSRTGSLLAGMAFTLSGYVVSLTDNLVYLYSICMLPFFCASLEKAFTGGRAWTTAPTLVWTTVFLNGDIQTGYYYGFVALLWVSLRVQDPLLARGRRLLLVSGLTVLLASVQLGPSGAVFVDSNRAQAALFQEQTLRWSTHPLRLVTMVAAPFGGDTDPVAAGRLFFGSPGYGVWAESIYLGIPVLGLALLGARHRRDLAVLALLGGCALILALGRFGGLYEIFNQVVPLWSAFRYPEKFMGVASFAVAMLAGAGLDALREGKGRPRLWLAAAVVCAAAGLGLSTDGASDWTAAHFSAPEALAREATGSGAHAFLFSALAALGMWLISTEFTRQRVRVPLLLGLALVLVPLDLARANWTAYHTGPAKAATFVPAFAKTLTKREGALAPGRFRIISTTQSETLWPEHLQRRLGYNGAISVARRQALDLGHNAEFHLEAVHPYLPAYSGALAVLLHQPPSIEADARLNVAYYIDRRSRLRDPRVAHGLVAELPDYDLGLFRNPVPPKPRAYLSLKPERTTSPADPTALHARPDFLSGEVDVIETSAATMPGPAQGGLAVIERYDPEDVRVRVDTPQPTVLILLDAYEKGWTATLDGGAELPILRANALVRAVIVPAGTHLITFSYRTPLLKAGAWVSLTGVLLCLGLIAHARRQARVNGLPRPAGRTVDT